MRQAYLAYICVGAYLRVYNKREVSKGTSLSDYVW